MRLPRTSTTSTAGLATSSRGSIRLGCVRFLLMLVAAAPVMLAVIPAVMPAAALAQTTFSNTSVMLLPIPPGTGSIDNSHPGEAASLYPSQITVSGMTGTITKLTVTLNDFRHPSPDDIDMLLVGPGGQKMVFWSDVGGVISTCSPTTDLEQYTLCNNTDQPGTTGPTITLDDSVAGLLPDNGPLTAGTFKPTNIGTVTDVFPAPAPAGPYSFAGPDGAATFSNVFGGANPNGAWQLYVIDDSYAGTGRINGGWSITITTGGGTSPKPTTTAITSDTPDPSVINGAVNVTYTVTGSGGSPTGNVTVTDGVGSCSGTVAAGQCSLILATPGNRTLTATYAGDAAFTGSSGTAPHMVLYNTTTTITADTPDPSAIGQAVTVSYTVAATPAGAASPTGIVTVTDGLATCTGTVSAGACAITLTSPGSRTLNATYAGDTANKGSTSAGAPHQVAATLLATTTTITSDTPDPSDVGQAVIVTWTVTGTSGTPTGTVTVADGFNSCTASVAAGQCTISSLTTSGNRTLTATYSGDSTFASSTGTAAHVVRFASTSTITADTPDPSSSGQAVTVVYSVASSGGPTPTGNVTVTDGSGATCAGTVAAGNCSIILSTVGARTLVATYVGDGFNKNSVSAGTAHQVTTAAASSTNTTITGDTPDPSDMNQAVVVTFTVTGASGTPSGNVTVTDGVSSCTATVAQGQCTITLTTPGTRTLSANYAGNATYAASSGSASHLVYYNTTTTINSDTPDPSTNTQSVTVTYAVSATVAGGPAPSGNVTVSDGVSTCSGTAAVGSCSMIMTTAGARTLVATYAGDASNKGSLSAGAAHTVVLPLPDLTIAKTHAGIFTPGQVGATYTITVSNSGQGASAGVVTVTDTLPGGLTATAIAGQGWSCAQPGGPCTRSDPLAAGGSYPAITLTVNVAANAPSSVTNVVGVAGGGDSNSGNNSASDLTAIGGTQFTLTASRLGTGTGTISTADNGISCGSTCAKAYASGTVVTLTATATTGSTFAGWSGACSGTQATCTITLDSNKAVSATFDGAASPKVLDVDDNGAYDALSDALIITRYMFGLTGSALSAGAIGSNAKRTDPTQIVNYLDGVRQQLDIDGNGQVDALTDGLLILRYMFGLRGGALVQGTVAANATRNTSQIESYIQSLMP